MRLMKSSFFGIIGYAAVVVHASAGDRAQPFQDCLVLCHSQRCSSNSPYHLPFFERLTRWTCLDDCKYTCMHLMTDLAQTDERPVMQYYGKWPFWRYMGMQEPASVLFSLFNLWVHIRGFKTMKRVTPDDHPMRRYLLVWSAVSMNAWLWSSVFHMRDTSNTERLDYFSAALAILTALHFTVARFFFIGRPRRRSLYNLWTVLCTLTYVAHVSYLNFLPRFDYSYNILFNLVLGLTHNFLWAVYSLPAKLTLIRRFPSFAVPRQHRPPFASKAAVCVGLTMAAMALELLDFPPIKRVLDAHALWHAATVPIAVLWYDFLVQDTLDEGWKSSRL